MEEQLNSKISKDLQISGQIFTAFKTNFKTPRVVACYLIIVSAFLGLLIGPYNSQAKQISTKRVYGLLSGVQYLTLHSLENSNSCLGFIETKLSPSQTNQIESKGSLLVAKNNKPFLADFTIAGDFSATSKLVRFNSSLNLGEEKIIATSKNSLPEELTLFLNSKTFTKSYSTAIPPETSLKRLGANQFEFKTSKIISDLIDSTIKEKKILVRSSNVNDLDRCKTELSENHLISTKSLPNASIYLKLLELTPPKKLVSRNLQNAEKKNDQS